MKCWCFKFEGVFKNGDPTYGCKGIFSSCLVPVPAYNKALSLFKQTLCENEIELVEIMEVFDVNGAELDITDTVNVFWVEWWKKAIVEQQPIFDEWHVFDNE